MYQLLQQRLQSIQDSKAFKILGTGLIGIEREVLRVTPSGKIAHSPHPQALGAALMHPYITTDYSEALLEFITPPLQNKQAVIQFLWDIHRSVYSQLDQEYLWAASMPCLLHGDESVPIAQYGSSNAGVMKNIYRRGLGLRYGRTMQAIAGVHFNYSLPVKFWPIFKELEKNNLNLRDFTDESYMGMVRNLQRYGWLVPYLFGSSPVVSRSFIGNRHTDLQVFTEDTLYYPYATSLRMGDIGYQNSLEEGKGFRANYHSLDAYIRSLNWATETPCPDYEQIGIINQGEYQQLNTNVLQIENEHYSTIRPKQILEWLEKPSLALRRRGIRYVELRSTDVNIFEPTGINIEQLYFCELLLLTCLFMASPRINQSEASIINANQILVAHRGREPGLRLHRNGNTLPMQDWAQELLTTMLPLAAMLDEACSVAAYKDALAMAQQRVSNPEITPSACLLARMREHGQGFLTFTERMSYSHRAAILAQGELVDERRIYFANLAHQSHERQLALEAADDRPFEQFLSEYFAQP